MTHALARPRRAAALLALLRAEAAASRAAPQSALWRALQRAVAVALFALALDGDAPAAARVAAMRLILAYSAGRPAPVAARAAPGYRGKTYVVVSPDDWPR